MKEVLAVYENAARLDIGLRGLHAFVVLAEERHFSHAAARLFVTPPALSQQIRRIESSLNVRLIDREARPLELTDAGRLLLEHARRILQEGEDLAGGLARVRRRESSTLRIGFVTGAAGALTGSILNALTCAFELEQIAWTKQTAAVASGEVDAAFVRPPLPATGGIELLTVVVEPRLAMLPPGHPLAGRSSLSVLELNGEVHVTTDRMPSEWLAWWSVDPRPDGRRVTFGPVVHTMDEQVQTVAAGLAVGITAASIADLYAGSGVVFVPLDDVEPCTVALCTRSRDSHPGVTELRRVVSELGAGHAAI
ncbi:LysR family transcriptional regulator [Branchiibius sp. NY16-3462-2]|uniref:LysR family transcriptional regulator n=1 Tax=Branchiibius sp. NY16-3462-2 TaxID=1807500 RepID=UPI00079738E1|nr:LysR family transcriptional regulator [Branchiibius sp. NY16-3462-2]KYH44116.1 transcriptional regulator [Branchiibius sp. NY16-3462-2]